MSDSMNLALQITAADMFSGVLNRFRSKILGSGRDVEKMRKQFDRASRDIATGIKAIAVANFGMNKLKPAVRASADLQESMLNIKQLLWSSNSGATALNKRLAEMRRSAIEVSSNLPYSATDLANIEGNLLQGGLRLKSIVGKQGAAFATAALASFNNMDPAVVAEAIAKSGHAFQLQGKQYNQYANDLSQVSAASPAKLPELLYGMQFAAPQAHFMGISPRVTATTLAAVSSIGPEAGTSLNAFLQGMTGANRRGAKYLRKSGLSFYDKGKFIGMDAAIKRLREFSKKLPNQQARMIELTRIFQQQGARVALLLIQHGNKSYESIQRAANSAASLAERERIWSEGLNASMKKLGGTSQSTLANIFNAALPPMTKLVMGTNTLVGNIGKMAGKHKSISQVISYGAGALVAGAGIYGLARLMRGGGSMLRLLRKAGSDVGGTAAGIAKGKAIEAATGVQPVFVTNFPQGFGAGGAAADVAAAAAGGGILGKLKGMGGKVLGLAMKLAPLAAGLVSLPVLAGIAAVGAAGYGGYRLYEHYNKGGSSSTTGQEPKSSLHIKLETAPGVKATVTRLQAGKGQHINVDSGMAMAGGF